MTKIINDNSKSYPPKISNHPLHRPSGYVYIWLDPITKVPFYVGMSLHFNLGKRAHRDVMEIQNPSSAELHAQKIFKTTGKKHMVKIWKRGLDEYNTKRIEIGLIKLLGRKDKGLGTLLNQTDGGDVAKRVYNFQIKTTY